MKLKKKLSLVLALVLAAQLCLPVGAAANLPDANPEAEMPTVSAEPEVPAAPEVPALDAPAEPAAIEGAIDISGADNYIVIEDDGYTIGANPKVFRPGPYVLTGSTTATNAPATEEPPYFTEISHIAVRNTNGKPIEITLSDVDIQLANTEEYHFCPFFIAEGAVNLTLLGSNKLTGGYLAPGLRVEEGRSLTITAESTGSLTAISKNDVLGYEESSAGIGCATTIGGSITILGGTVSATGGDSDERTGDPGPGIFGSNVTISGGLVTAAGGEGRVNIGIRGNFSTGANSNAVIFASTIKDQTQKASWSGMIFEGDKGFLYSDSVTPSASITIPAGTELLIAAGQTLTMSDGLTLTNNGSILLDPHGAIVGTRIGNEPIDCISIDIGGADNYIAITDTGYKIGKAAKEKKWTGPYILTGSTTATNAPSLNHISVWNSGETPIDITLNNVKIEFPVIRDNPPAYCPFSIDKGAVNLTLAGQNSLKADSQSPGLRVETGKKLTITDKSTGSLNARGGYGVWLTARGGAGIGGGGQCSGGDITINGGYIDASSSDDGASIGGGGGETGSGDIAINSGTVMADDGIGWGPGSDVHTGTFSANGNAVIFASKIRNKDQIGSWRAMVFEGDGTGHGIIYGKGDFILPGSLIISYLYDLSMEPGQNLIVPKDATLTVDGYIYKYGGTVVAEGTIINPERIFPTNPVNIALQDITIGGPGTGCHPCRGHLFYGKGTDYHVTVLGGTHQIELRDISIRYDQGDSAIQYNKGGSAFSLDNGATVDLTLVGTNTFSGKENYAGLAVHEGCTLNITKESTGTLNAIGGYYGAGIGGDYAGSTVSPPGTININGGTVNATGGGDAAGIGGGWRCGGGTININGCRVTAQGGAQGAGIGGGDEGAGGNITITSSDVTATGGNYAAGIGGGYYGAGDSVKIDGGNVTATGGSNGAGIGGGDNGAGGIVTISGNVTATGGSKAAGIGGGNKGKGGNTTIGGGTVKATGGYYAAGIGGGYKGNGGATAITGGDVTATGGWHGAGIGGGDNDNASGNEGDGGDVTISSGTVTATGGINGAGIGGGNKGVGGTVKISGGTVSAEGHGWGAGIGGGSKGVCGSITITGGKIDAKGGTSNPAGTDPFGGAGIGFGGVSNRFAHDGLPSSGSITIKGGTVNATGGRDGAGIGGGSFGTVEKIWIDGGTVSATGGNRGAGIGSGVESKGAGDITIADNAVVFAMRNNDQTAYIGKGKDSTGRVSVYRKGGIIFEGNKGTFYGTRVNLLADVTIPAGKSLTIGKGQTLANENVTLFLDGGTIIDGGGSLAGYGTYKASMVSGDIPDIPDQVYTGGNIEPDVKVKTTRYFMGRTFAVLTDGFYRDHVNNTNAGTAKIQFIRENYPTAEKNFRIIKSGATVDIQRVYNYLDGRDTTTFTYGDVIAVRAKPKATGVVAATLALTPPAPNDMALFYLDSQLSDRVGPYRGEYLMRYHTADKKLAPGDYTISAKFVDNGSMASASADIPIKLLPKPLTAKISDHCRMEKTYDGGTDVANVPLTLTGVASGDAATATATGTATSANVGTHAFSASATTMGG
ncbi:MAG: hypothetical protein RSB55_04365, partial [Oscillospiraceae bacterium]